jgi:hypothetical protein
MQNIQGRASLNESGTNGVAVGNGFVEKDVETVSSGVPVAAAIGCEKDEPRKDPQLFLDSFSDDYVLS